MKILPKTFDEAIESVWEILNQGDSRYNDPSNEVSLAYSLLDQIVSLEERKIPEIININKEKFQSIKGIQKHEKYLVKLLLKKQGFKDNEIFFERRFQGSRPDVMAESKDEIILIECCSCRIDKILNYLLHVNEVWVIVRGQPPWEKTPLFKDKMKWFVFKKGENWDKFLKLKDKEIEELKKIKSPLDYSTN